MGTVGHRGHRWDLVDIVVAELGAPFGHRITWGLSFQKYTLDSMIIHLVPGAPLMIWLFSDPSHMAEEGHYPFLLLRGYVIPPQLRNFKKERN